MAASAIGNGSRASRLSGSYPAYRLNPAVPEGQHSSNPTELFEVIVHTIRGSALTTEMKAMLFAPGCVQWAAEKRRANVHLWTKLNFAII
jgi:hypothetical protein